MTIKNLENITTETRKAIKAHLEKTGISAGTLARAAGVHPLQLNGFLNDEAGLTLASVEKIAAAMKNQKG